MRLSPRSPGLQALRRLYQAQHGVTAVETALILPVLLFGVMMLFELARIALVIGIGGLSLERALQDFRHDRAFYSQSTQSMQQTIEQRVIDGAYGLLDESDLLVELLAFDNLRQAGGGAPNEDQDSKDLSPPVLSVTLDMTERFITPLPALFGLGDAFQYQYRQLLGNLSSEREEDDAEDSP